MARSICLLLLALLGGCQVQPNLKPQPVIEPVEVPVTGAQPLSVAVLQLNDKTGARRRGADYSEGSSAVSQGITEWVKYLLLSEPRFDHVSQFDRGVLNQLLTEKQLRDEHQKAVLSQAQARVGNGLLSDILSKAKSRAENTMLLKPVDYFVTGAVIGYDHSVSSDGQAGAFLGYRAQQSRSADVLYVSLNLVDTRTGQIVAAASSDQVVLTREQRGGLIKFLSHTDLLELEGGQTERDSVTLALRTALRNCLLTLFAQLES